MSVFDPFHHDHINTPVNTPLITPLNFRWLGGVAWKLGGYNPPWGVWINHCTHVLFGYYRGRCKFSGAAKLPLVPVWLRLLNLQNFFSIIGDYTIFIRATRSIARYLLWKDGWLAVTRRYCVKTAKPILKLFDRLVARRSSFFLTPAPIPNSNGNPFSGGAKYNGVVGKFSDFRLKSPSKSETVRDSPMVAIER